MKVRAAVVLLMLASACIISRGVEVSRLTAGRSDSTVVHSPVKAHLVDGSVAVFSSGATVVRDRVRGNAWRFTATLRESTLVSEVPLDSVIGMEAFNTRIDNARTLIYSAAATSAVLLGTVAAICIADPKCFGSCPTIYSDSNGTPVLEAEGFSYSISPLLEARDVDRLRAQPDTAGILRLQVWNEALETQYINQLELIEAVHGADELVLPDERGRPVAVTHLAPPAAVVDRAGRDVRPFIVAPSDGRVFATDSGVLARAAPAHSDDQLDLTIGNPRRSDTVAVVMRLRNSLLNTVLFYDLMLAQPGARSLDWLANDLQRIGTTVDLGRWYNKYLGMRFYVESGGAGRWKLAARLSDYGPIAWRDVATVIAIPRDTVVRLRLTFLADQWRIDRIAIGDGVRRPRVRTIPLSAVLTAEGDSEPRALQNLQQADDRYLQTTPPQRFTVAFDVGAPRPDSLRTFFLASQGYYIEWVRGSWMRGLRDTSTFTPSDDVLQRGLKLWAAQKDSLERSFYRTRIPVR